MAASTLRIALLGKTGSGKSSLGNTMFGETVFDPYHEADPGTSECKAASKEVHGRNITLIDTPGTFDTRKSEEELKSEMAKCITECSPGLHAFLILLKVERFTEHEQQVISKIQQSFSDEAFKYAVLVFTHGDQLPITRDGDTMKIEDFVEKSQSLRDLSSKCGGRCHVIDNKYWNNNQQSKYRNNQSQVVELLSTINKMVEENEGGCYTNEMLQNVERKIQEEERRIRSESGDMSDIEIREQAKSNVSHYLKMAAGITTGVLLGALLGIPALIIKVVELLVTSQVIRVAATASGEVALPVCLGVVGAVATAAGAAYGGYIGHREAAEADSASEAAKNTAKALGEKVLAPAKILVGKMKSQQREENYHLLN